MATYVNNLRLKEIATGDESGTWGTSTNTNLELVGQGLGFGTEAITTNADTHASTVADGSADEARAMYIKYTGTLDSACTITIGPNTLKRVHFIENATSGSQNIIIKQGSGSTVTIGSGDVKVVYLDGAGSGAAVNDAFASLSTVDLKVSDDLTVTDDASVGGDLLVSGEVQTANIGFTDGDNAITIADGGGITAAAGITSTAASNSFGATSFNDANITNVGDIALDSLSADGSSISIASPVVINGSTPTLTIGDAGEEDTKLVFDGNAQDFYIGLDDSADDLLIGNGSTVGSNVAIGVNESQVVQFNGAYTFPTSDGSADQVLKTNGSGALSFGTVSAGTPTSIADADGDTNLKTLAVDDSSTIGCDSDTDLMTLSDGALNVAGTLACDTSFTLDAVTVDATELGYIDGVTAGTAAASKALVLDANKAIGTISHLTATYAKIDVLDVNEINSVTRTETTLEVVDKLIIAGSGSASAAAAGGGLQIGGSGGSDTVASVLYDHANTALDFNIGGTTEMRLQDGVLRPETDNDVDLGASGAEFKDLYLDGVAYIDDLRADQLGAALDANSQAITNINVDSGVIDNTVIGGNTAAAGTFTTLVAGGNVDLGDATSDTITATGRFDSDLVPSTDSARALGTSALQWSAVHVDVGHIDQLGSALDGNSQNVTGVGTFSAGGSTVTSLSVSDGNITNVADIALDSISADGTDIDITLTDNSSTALEIKEGSTAYMVFDTTNSEEAIFFKKELEVEQGAVVYDNKEVQFATDDAGTGASGSLKYVAASDVFEISGSGANGIRISGSLSLSGESDGGGTYGIEAGQASFAATTVTSLSVSDGNITNVGSLACDSILVDDAAVGLDVRFGGNTGLNKLTLTDNLASALDINEGGTSYLKFVTSNGNEGIEFSKETEFKAGGIVADDQAMVFGDDDDGSIAFISAANVVRFDGGSAGLHFNDTSAFGADGSGKDVSFHGL